MVRLYVRIILERRSAETVYEDQPCGEDRNFRLSVSCEDLNRERGRRPEKKQKIAVGLSSLYPAEPSPVMSARRIRKRRGKGD